MLSGASVKDMTRTTDRGRSSFSHTFFFWGGGGGGGGAEGGFFFFSHCTLNNYDVHE